MNRGKPYDTRVDRGKQRAPDGKKPSGGGVPPNLIKCFRCGRMGHCVVECQSDVTKCFKCG